MDFMAVAWKECSFPILPVVSRKTIVKSSFVIGNQSQLSVLKCQKAWRFTHLDSSTLKHYDVTLPAGSLWHVEELELNSMHGRLSTLDIWKCETFDIRFRACCLLKWSDSKSRVCLQSQWWCLVSWKKMKSRMSISWCCLQERTS